MAERDVLAGKAMEEFASYNPDVVVTSCPLCKKTFAKVNSVAVKDLAEVVVGAMEK
jgi:Fe-S oxidoreductase